MHATNLRRMLVAALALCTARALPLAAQQQPVRRGPASAQQAAPRQPQALPRGTAPAARTAQAASQPTAQGGTRPPTAASQRRPAGQYPVRQAGANDAQTPAPQGPPAQGAAPAAAPPAGAAPLPPPTAPFQLSQAEQQLLDQVLARWEKQSSRIKTFKCNFGRWDVDQTFGPKQNNYVRSDGKGYIKYKAPDHGVYRVTELTEWDADKQVYVPKAEGLDHWVCDGKTIFEFNDAKRQLIERPLAPEMQGKAITDGPLPFIFGARADEIKRRYWMRDITPTAQAGTQIWLEAWPKFQQDRANYHHAIVILNQSDFMPWALRIIQPDGKNSMDYQFVNTVVNDPLSTLKLDFAPPVTPWNWQRVVEKLPAAEQAQQVAPPENRR
jgi:TIGR03009 family protein